MPYVESPPALTFEPAALDWQQQVQNAVRDPQELCQRLRLPASYWDGAQRAAEQFPVFAPQSYIARMEIGNPCDPLLRQVLPLDAELSQPAEYSQDPVGDGPARSQPGLIQKYHGRVLLITTNLCAIHCRYCFRRHYPYDGEPKSLSAWQPAMRQIAQDTSIHEVILSGGDPLSLSDSKLRSLMSAFGEIPHLRRLRVHSRLPIVIPARVTNDLIDWLTSCRMVPYLVLHVNHAHELSEEVLRAIAKLHQAGIVLLNQAVLLRGVNDTVAALVELCERLSDHRVLPYYLHQLDRVQGAAHFEVSISRGKELIEKLRERLPGYAVPRYVQDEPGTGSKTILL